jgi:hypothetical protein
MLYLCFTPASPLLVHVTAAILPYLHIFIYTPAFLVLYYYFSWCVCVCVCRLSGFVESVEESEGLRRDGAWEHGVLQQRAAGEAPLHEPPHVSLLILLAPAQAHTRLQERQRVSRATQVREMHVV